MRRRGEGGGGGDINVRKLNAHRSSVKLMPT